MAWRRLTRPRPDRAALSISQLEDSLGFRARPGEYVIDPEGRTESAIQIVPAGFPFTDRKVWLVVVATPTAGDVRLELSTTLVPGGERQPLATLDYHWPEDKAAVAPAGWSLASLEPALVEAHEHRGAEESPGELLEIIRDRLEQIRAVELEERPELASLAKPAGRGRPPEFPGDGLRL